MAKAPDNELLLDVDDDDDSDSDSDKQEDHQASLSRCSED
jgi:hypothetical protein